MILFISNPLNVKTIKDGEEISACPGIGDRDSVYGYSSGEPYGTHFCTWLRWCYTTLVIKCIEQYIRRDKWMHVKLLKCEYGFWNVSVSILIMCIIVSLLGKTGWRVHRTSCTLFCCCCCCFVCFLGPHLRHMEVPRLGVQLELQLPGCTTATVTWDPSRIFGVHHSSWQCWVLNPLSKARDQTCNLMFSSRIC